jgi:hypothetical protein
VHGHHAPVPYTSTATSMATTVETSHMTNIDSEKECHTANLLIFVVPVSSVAMLATCAPLAGKK